MKKKDYVVLLLIVLIAISAFTTNQPKAISQGNTLKIGLLTDLSGPTSVYGLEQEHGFMLGLEYATGGTMEVAGRPIEVLVRDDASSITAAKENVEDLRNWGAELFFGTVSSTATFEIQKMVNSYGKILMVGPAAAPALTGENFNQTTFRVCPNAYQEATTAVGYATETFGENYMLLTAVKKPRKEITSAYQGRDYYLIDSDDVEGRGFKTAAWSDNGKILTELVVDNRTGERFIVMSPSEVNPDFCTESPDDSMCVAMNWINGPAEEERATRALNTAFGSDPVSIFKYVLQQKEASPVDAPLELFYQDTDFAEPILRIMVSDADFALFLWTGINGTSPAAQAAETGLVERKPFLQWADTNYYFARSGSAVPESLAFTPYHYTLPDNEINDWLVEQNQAQYEMPEEFQAMYPGQGEVPGLFTECGFATAQALVAALETTSGNTRANSMTPALEGLSFEGPKGTYTIRPEDHQALFPMYIVKVVTDTPEVPFAYFELVQKVSPEDSAPPCEAVGRSSDTVTCEPIVMEEEVTEESSQ